MSEAVRDAMSVAMAALGRRALSRAELERRLAAAEFTEATIAAVLQRLEELRLIDDRALAERVARHRFEAGRAGRYRVRAELKRRGVSEQLVDDAIASSVPAEGERASARSELERFVRSRARRRETRERTAAAAFRHLVGRGYPADLVRDLLGVSL